MLGDLISRFAEFARVHQAWAPPVACALAFLKSMPIVSFFIPATAPLLALGALIGAGALPFLPIWLAVSLGAALGDWLSYGLGYVCRDKIRTMWPFALSPQRFAQGEAFFRRSGAAGQGDGMARRHFLSVDQHVLQGGAQGLELAVKKIQHFPGGFQALAPRVMRIHVPGAGHFVDDARGHSAQDRSNVAASKRLE